MTNCLIKGGCEKIHFFYRLNSAYSVAARLAGCRSSCFNANINFSDENIFCGEPSDLNLVKRISITPGKTGILCANDTTAAILMSSLHKLRINNRKYSRSF